MEQPEFVGRNQAEQLAGVSKGNIHKVRGFPEPEYGPDYEGRRYLHIPLWRREVVEAYGKTRKGRV